MSSCQPWSAYTQFSVSSLQDNSVGGNNLVLAHNDKQQGTDAQVVKSTFQQKAASSKGRNLMHKVTRALLSSALLFGLASPLAAVAADNSMWQAVGRQTSSVSGTRVPLLMEGKSTLYQRVLTTPECRLYKNLNNQGFGTPVAAFSQFYVYGDAPGFFEVGTNTTGDVVGFLKKDCLIPWRQQLALHFTNPAGRQRALIFEKDEVLEQMLQSKNASAQYISLFPKLISGQRVPGVISIEPENYIDPKENFYLLPILNSSESMFADGSYTYKHEIASVVADSLNQNKSAAPQNQQVSGVVGFKSAIVFVIDSSISMRPYIERTKEVVKSIYKNIEQNNLNDSVHFGVVSFRGDSRLVPGLEYTTRVHLKPGDASTWGEFQRAVNSLDQASVSSKQFNEDAYAGIAAALKEIPWKNYGGRYIVLITDAGAIEGSDSQSSTGLNAKELRVESEAQGAAIYTMHLLTNVGKQNHNSARAQYTELSYNKLLGKPLYYEVDTGSVEAFGKSMDLLSNAIVEQVTNATQGLMSVGSALTAEVDANDELNQGLLNDTSNLGYAMQLAYLGRIQGTKSPSFLRGWIADRDLVDHNKLVCEPVVLVNRNQLSDLYTLVKGVLASGVAGQVSSDNMFSQLQALAAQMGRDPNQLSKSKSISEMGLMNELLDGLPYKSRIASLTPDDWYRLGSHDQDKIIKDLESSMNYLEQCSSDNERWIKINQMSDESEAVYPIPLEVLP